MKSIKVLLSTVLCFCILLVENGYSKNITENSKIIKILSIGNSFSQDAVEQYLYELGFNVYPIGKKSLVHV